MRSLGNLWVSGTQAPCGWPGHLGKAERAHLMLPGALCVKVLSQTPTKREASGRVWLSNKWGTVSALFAFALFWPPCSARQQSLQSRMPCTSSFLPSHKLPSYLGQSPSSSCPSLQREGKLLLIFSSALGFSPCPCFLWRFGPTTLLQDPTGLGLSPTKLPSNCPSDLPAIDQRFQQTLPLVLLVCLSNSQNSDKHFT